MPELRVEESKEIVRMAWKAWMLLLPIFMVSQLAFAQSKETDNALAIHQNIVLRRSVSLVKLLARPEKFARKRIWVRGCFHLRNNALYLSKEDAIHNNDLNAISLSFEKVVSIGSHSQVEPNAPLEELNFEHVGVEGTFIPTKGPSNYIGELANINRIIGL